jgi:hypothetical protein
MNNFLVALLTLAATGTLYLSQQPSLSEAHRTNQALMAALDQARGDWQAMTQQVAAAQAGLTQRRADLAAAREDLARVAKAAQAIAPPPIEPAAEGTWPATKPYFYLLKKRLGEVEYSPLTSDKHLSEEAGILFGMTAAERAAVDNSVQKLREGVQQLQSTHAQLAPTAPSQNSAVHQEISYQIPLLTNEFNQLEQECEGGIAAALGESRASLFLQRAKPLLMEMYGRFGNQAYKATLYADRNDSGEVSHQLKVVQETPSGNTMYNYPVYFPLTPDTALWDYRHLFGQEPLLREAPGQGQ